MSKLLKYRGKEVPACAGGMCVAVCPPICLVQPKTPLSRYLVVTCAEMAFSWSFGKFSSNTQDERRPLLPAVTPFARRWSSVSRRWISTLLIVISAPLAYFLYARYIVSRPSSKWSPSYPSTQLPISHMFKNIAAGPNASFDPHYHNAYAAEFLPRGRFQFDGVDVSQGFCHQTVGTLGDNRRWWQFKLPVDWANGKADNVVVQGERIDHLLGDNHTYVREFHVLYAGDWIDGELHLRIARRTLIKQSFYQAKMGIDLRSSLRMGADTR